MLEFLYEWIRNIIIFLVLTTIINNLLGKSSYRKYVDLITGLILLLLVISPLFQLFQIEDRLEYFFSANNLLAKTKDFDLTFEDAEISKKHLILQEYKENLKTQIANILEEDKIYITFIDIRIEEDSSSGKYGQIKQLDIVASYIRDTEVKSMEGVNKITINKIVIQSDIIIGQETESSNDKNRDKLPTPDEINAKKRLSDFYNLNTDNINISIQE